MMRRFLLVGEVRFLGLCRSLGSFLMVLDIPPYLCMLDLFNSFVSKLTGWRDCVSADLCGRKGFGECGLPGKLQALGFSMNELKAVPLRWKTLSCGTEKEDSSVKKRRHLTPEKVGVG